MGKDNPREPQQLDGARLNGAEFDRTLLRAIQEASPDGILVVNDRGAVVSYNQRFIDIWRIPPDHIKAENGDGSVLDKPILLTVTQQVSNPREFLDRIEKLYANPEATDECEIDLKDGRTLERHSVGLCDSENRYLGRVWFFRDISDRKATERKLQELAWRDPLTGVMNRTQFFQRAAEEVAKSRRSGDVLGILMLDLDHFKQVNDKYGHAAGDEVLKAVCARWAKLLRSGDLLARLGGEEFAVLIPGCTLDAAEALAERLRLSLDGEPISANGAKAIECTVSIGATLLHPDEAGVEVALRRADLALYRAKANGRNRVEVES